MGVGEAPFHIGHGTTVGGRGPDHIRSLAFSSVIPRPQDIGTKAIAVREGLQLASDAVDSIIVGITSGGSIGIVGYESHGDGVLSTAC